MIISFQITSFTQTFKFMLDIIFYIEKIWSKASIFQSKVKGLLETGPSQTWSTVNCMVKQSNHELPGVNHIVYQNWTIDMQKNYKIPLTTSMSYISTVSFHRLRIESRNSKKKNSSSTTIKIASGLCIKSSCEIHWSDQNIKFQFWIFKFQLFISLCKTQSIFNTLATWMNILFRSFQFYC